MTNVEPIVSFHHVGIHFGPQVVHRDITFDIYPGEVLTILGPSGTGKTLLLKMMIGLLTPTSGDVTVFGQEIQNLKEEDLREIRMQIGMLFQGAALFDSLSVYDNIAYALHEAGTYSEEEIDRIVKEKLKLVNLPGIEHKFPSQLSGGQKKRVGLARALASSPRVVLFDEPTTGLDQTSARLIDELIITLRNKFNITSIVVTHDIESAKRISDRWMLINLGQVLVQGTVNELLAKSDEVKAFIEGRWIENGPGDSFVNP